MSSQNFRNDVSLLLENNFSPAGYKLTNGVALDSIPESVKYDGLVFSFNEKHIVYRKGNNTEDRPGAFLALWKRPSLSGETKPIPLAADDLDYLFIQVEHSAETGDHTVQRGLFMFPVSLLIAKGIVSSPKHKGKTGFRVFPPWSQDRGTQGTQVFSESGKKTQRWQLPYFVDIDESGLIAASKLDAILSL